MKITGHNPYARVDSTRRHADRGGSERPEAGGVRGEATEVRMSPAAEAFSHARAPERPDPERIERLRQAIANGELKIDPRKIAARMLEEEL